MIDRAKRSKAESRSAAIRATVNDTSAIQGQLLSNIHNAMKRLEQIQRSQACQAIHPSQAIKMPRARETHFSDVEMKLFGSRQGQSDFDDPGGHTPYESEQDDLRRPLMEPAEVS